MTVARRALSLVPGGPPCTPGNLDALISALGVEVQYRRDRLAFNGSTDLQRDVPLIELAWTRRTDSPSLLPWGDGDRLSSSLPHQYDARTRFTLAHEFGHVLLHRLDALHPPARTMSPRDVESVCDSIGAELLMPTAWFTEQIGREAKFDTLRRASIRAGTSISATVVRARVLGYRVGALHLSPNLRCGWRIDRSYGLRAAAGTTISDNCGDNLDRIPMKSIREADLELTCSGHSHRLSAEIRRTFTSAVAIVHRVDGTAVRSGSNWRCPRC